MKFNFNTLKNTIKTEYNGYINMGQLLEKIGGLLTEDEMDAYLDGLDKNFNIILLRNGESFVVLKNIKAIRNFLDEEEIDDNADIWNNYYELANGKKRQLKTI